MVVQCVRSHSFLFLATFLCSFSWQNIGGYAAEVNVTVDDSDSSIQYQPSTAWQAMSAACTGCPNASVFSAFHDTFHEGFHVVLPDADDSTPSSSSSGPTATPTPSPSGGASDKGKGQGKGKSGEKRDRLHRNLGLIARTDADDPNFKDAPVTVEFAFNGTAVYMFCILPLGPGTVSNPTITNLSFTIDNIPYGHYLHNGSTSQSGFASNVTVLAVENLTPTPHILEAAVGLNSLVFFDYIVYTTLGESPDPPEGSTMTPSPVSTPTSHRNVSTFAGVIGGVVGALALMAFSIFLSLSFRRWRSSRRERLSRDHEGRPMQGPRPFIPRYFPGTVPPPYTPSIPSSQHSTLHTFPIVPTTALEPTSCLGTEPCSDSLPLDEASPPAFSVAITSPDPILQSSPMRGVVTTSRTSPGDTTPPQGQVFDHVSVHSSHTASHTEDTGSHTENQIPTRQISRPAVDPEATEPPSSLSPAAIYQNEVEGLVSSTDRG